MDRDSEFVVPCILLSPNGVAQYSITFYLSYLARWPELCAAEVSPSGKMMGYGTTILAAYTTSY